VSDPRHRGPLETWLAPLGVEAFRHEYLAKRSLFLEASAERLATALPLRSWAVEDLLHNPRVKAWTWFQDASGRHQTAAVPNESALALYRGGLTLYLKHVPEIAPLAREVARALKVPDHHVKYTVFCNAPGSKTRAHFDPVDTMALQLGGRKRWRIAPNALSPRPTASWTTLDGSEGDAEIWFYTHGDLPTRMPAGEVEEYLLEPGALLHVPRGYWHETDSPEASVSLHLHHVSLPWADAVLVALRALLLRDPAWREGALGLWDDAQAGANEREAGRRLRSLVAAASRLAPADVLPALARASAPRPEGLMVRRARAGFAVETPEGGADASRVTFVVSECGSERRTTVEMSASYLRACRLFAESPEGGPFSAEGLAARVPGLTDDDARALVSLLLAVGFLRPV
jgi:50S ribosomal protein L16 3-hydroxylase